jgi:hypothetical protein
VSYEYPQGHHGWFCHNLLECLRQHPGDEIGVTDLAKAVGARMRANAWRELPEAVGQEPHVVTEGRPLTLHLEPVAKAVFAPPASSGASQVRRLVGWVFRWAPKPLERPRIDREVPHLPVLQRCSGVMVYWAQRLEYGMAPGGELRALLVLGLRVFLAGAVLMALALLTLVLVSLLVSSTGG